MSVPLERLPDEASVAPLVGGTTADARRAVERALLAHYPGLVSLLVRRVGGNRALALDVLQDAIVTTLTKFGEGARLDPQTVAGYVFKTAINHLRNHQRRESQRGDGVRDADSLEGDASGAPAEQSQRETLRGIVRRVLEDLPSRRDRELIARFYLDDEDKESICSSLGLSELQFNRVVFRAKARLRTIAERAGLTRWDVVGIALLAATLGPWLASVG